MNNFSERFGPLRDAFGLLFRRRFRFLKVLGVNQDDKASEWQEKIETTPELLAELKDKARQRGLSLFAYLAHFVSQDNEDIRRENPLSGGLRKQTQRTDQDETPPIWRTWRLGE